MVGNCQEKKSRAYCKSETTYCENLTSLSMDVYYNIADSEGNNHRMWVSYTYWDIIVDDDGTIWIFLFYYYVGDEAVQDFFDEHTSNNNNGN